MSQSFYIKKFIVVFLFISLISGLFSFVFSQRDIQPASTDTRTQQKTADVSTIGSNAFLEDVPTDPLLEKGYLIGDNVPPTIKPSANLTDRFLQQASYQILKSNPEGPSNAEGGNVSLISPDIDYITKNSLSANFSAASIPNWGNTFLPITSSIPNTPENIDRYKTLLKSIIEDNFINSSIDLTSETLSRDSLRTAYLSFSDANKKLKNLPVPAQFLSFHNNFMMVVAYQGQLIDFTSNNLHDPLRVGLAMEANKSSFNKILSQLSKEAQISGIFTIASNSLAHDDFWNTTARSLFSIPTAHAFLGFGDIVWDPQKFFRDIWEWIQHNLIRLLVKQLINQIQKDLVNWIAGGGKPKFITNWKDTLANTGKTAGDLILSANAPFLCKDFGPLVELALTPITNNQDKDPSNITCTVDDVIDNVEDFYQSFTNGGWRAYFTVIQPQNNFWGAYFILSDKMQRQVDQTVAAERNRALSSDGFSSTGVGCSNPVTKDNIAEEDLDYLKNSGITIVNSSCKPDPSLGHSVCKVTVCSQDDVQYKTPGSAVANSLFGSLNWKANQISVASSFIELVAALIDASINRLVNLAGGWVSGSGGTSGTGNSQGITGSTTGDGLDPDATGDPQLAEEQKQDVLDSAQRKAETVNDIISLYQQVTTAAQQLATQGCTNYASEIQPLLDKIITEFTALNLQSSYAKLLDLIAQIKALSVTDSDFASKLAKLNTAVSNTPKEETLFQLQADLQQLQTVLSSFSCQKASTP